MGQGARVLRLDSQTSANNGDESSSNNGRLLKEGKLLRGKLGRFGNKSRSTYLTQKKSSIFMANNPELVHVDYKALKADLENSRIGHVNKIKDQKYSYIEDFADFRISAQLRSKVLNMDSNKMKKKNPEILSGDARVDVSKLDLCVLANKASKAPGNVPKQCQDEAVVVPVALPPLQGDNGSDEDPESETNIGYMLAIFDGHGPRGDRVALVCVTQLQEYLSEESHILALDADPEMWIKEAIEYLHQTVKVNENLSPRLSGTTATLAFLENRTLHLGWVGDSKAVLFFCFDEDFSGEFHGLDVTTEHNFNTSEEVKRVESKGGLVKRDYIGRKKTLNAAGQVQYEDLHGPYRVYAARTFGTMAPGLAVSKSIGDALAHQVGCSSDADYAKINLDAYLSRTFTIQSGAQKGEFKVSTEMQKNVRHMVLVLASDGLWNVMNTMQVGKHLQTELKKRYDRPGTKEQINELNDNLSAGLCIKAQGIWLDIMGSKPGNSDDVTVITAVLF